MAQLRDSLIAGDLRVTGTIYGITTSSMKLVTPRTINGTNFDGTANITTANWGTARNISISDSAGSNTGTAVSVNGSAAVTLKLPATIKASITGNASSATAFASAQTISLTGDITGSASSTGGWTISTAIGTGKVTNAMLAGSIANGKLANSSVVIAGKTLSLGGTLSADDLRGALGLSSAMHFLGITTTSMSDGLATAAVVIGGNSKTPAAGDVVIDNNSAYEYVWSGSKWERLGPDGSYSLSDHVHGNITNGGLLGTASVAVVTDANKKITTANLATSDPSASGSGITYIASISQNGQGKITATKSTVRDASASQSGVVSTGAQTFAGDKTFNGNIISTKSIYFGTGTGSGKSILAYSSSYPNYGIWYFDENTDVMTFSASNNGNSKTGADLSINGQGDGTLSTRNRRIPHTNNTTGSVGGATVPVYVEGGAIKPITSYSGNAATATKVNKQLKLTNSRAYDGSSEVTLLTNDLTPAVSKTYSGTTYYGTGDNDTSNAFYFLQVKPDSWYKSWTVHFKVRTTIPGQAANYDSTTWSMITGRANDVVYHNWNDRYDHAHYYIAVYRLNQTGFNAGYSHAIGVNIRYSSNYTNSAWYRKFELEYYKCEGCTVTVLDAPLLQANWPGNGTTNFSGVYNLDAINRGLRESSDDNTINQVQMDNNYMINSPNFRLPGYTIFGFSREGKSQGISLYSADYIGTTASINTARTYNNEGFDWTRDLQYLSSGSNFGKGADVNVSTKTSQSAVDIRYTDNNVSSAGTTLSLVPRKPVYLRGIIKEDGLFYLAPMDVTYNNATYKKVWTQDIPTSIETDGTYQYVYWLIGNPYYTYSHCVNLYDNNPVYWYNNNKFEKFKGQTSLIGGNTFISPLRIWNKTTTNRLSLASGLPGIASYGKMYQYGTMIYSNGISMRDPYTGSGNDASWIRHIEETSNSGLLEIAVGDDGNEAIKVRQYNTSSAIAAEITLLDASHNSIMRNINPLSTNAYTLGTTSLRWQKAFIGTADSYGSATQPVYWNAGVPTTTTYALKATVNNATQWGVAYYSTSTNLTSTAIGTAGYLLQGNGSAAPSWIQATNNNTANTIVKRDGSGNFNGNTITAATSVVSPLLLGHLMYGRAWPYGKNEYQYHEVLTSQTFKLADQVNTDIVVLMSRYYGGYDNGILHLSCRKESNSSVPQYKGEWLVKQNTDNNNFILTWKYDSANDVLVLKLYIKVDGFSSYNITRLLDSSWSSPNNNGWIFHDVVQNTSNKSPYAYAAIPEDENQSYPEAVNLLNNALTATTLKTARTIRTNLSSTSNASFDGSSNITPGVTGTLAVANGGTGVTTIADIQAGKDGAGNTITSKYVTLDTEQTISGAKIFTNNVKIRGTVNGSDTINADVYGLMIGPKDTRITTANSYYPGLAFNHMLRFNNSNSYLNSPQAWIGLRLKDTPGSERSSLVFATKNGTGAADIPTERMCILPSGEVGIGTKTPAYLLHVEGTGGFKGNVVPIEDNTYTLGMSTSKWKEIYATTFTGNLSGNAATATALTSNAGSGTQPIYFSGGKPVATTYALNATVNSGTTNQVAYYSSATAISSKAPAWEAWVAGTTAGPQAKIQIGNASYTSAAIPVASTSASGVVTTTVQAFAGDKTFTGAIIEDHNKIMINRVTSFSTSSTYAKDSFVWYNNKVWKCTTAVTSAGAWTGSTNWSSVWSTDAKDTILNSGNYRVGLLDDSIGLMPAANNWNSIGASNLFWYRSYVTNYYGTTSFVTNWASGNNIGSSANSSSAATKGNINFYNDCAKGNTQTKTNLTAGSATSNITITLPSTTGTLVLTDGTGATGTWGISVSGSSASCTGNAATATAFSASKEIKLTGDVTGSNSSTGGWSITTTISNSGVTAGSYGPSGNQTPAYGATFDVPYFTVNAQGRITAASTKTVKIPSADNTDTKNTAGSNQDTAKMFLVGAKSQTTGSNGVQTYSHTKVYATNGQLDADKVRVGEHVTFQYNATTQCLEYVFA